MPVSPEVADSNRRETERLRRLVATLDPAAYRVRLPNGWSIAATLGHLAFWDRQRLELMRRWAAGVECTNVYAGEVINNALSPIVERLTPAQAAAAALEAAEAVDALLLEVPDEVVAAALARPDKPNLDRGLHRGHHLDQIDAALAAAGWSPGGTP